MRHGVWTEKEDILIVTLRLGTTWSWQEIEKVFRDLSNSDASFKDLESRFNKKLKTSDIMVWIDDFRHSGVIAESTNEEDKIRTILQAIIFLSDLNEVDRLF
jgi:hypothetical protein